MTIYKIRSKTNGLFSRGGVWPTFNTKGKVWKRKGDLSSHFSQLCNTKKKCYDDCEVLAYEVKEEEVMRSPVSEWLEERLEVKKMKEQQRAESWKKYQEELERKKLAELKIKYE